MTASSPTRVRIGRLVTDAQSRRQTRTEQASLLRQLDTYRTRTELSELSAIAARCDQRDSAMLRRMISRQLSR
jgi:hypothetical protein